MTYLVWLSLLVVTTVLYFIVGFEPTVLGLLIGIQLSIWLERRTQR